MRGWEKKDPTGLKHTTNEKKPVVMHLLLSGHMFCVILSALPFLPKALLTLNLASTGYQLVGCVWGTYLTFQRCQEVRDPTVAFKG